MRYQIYEAKSVKYDAQQRVGIDSPFQQILKKCDLRIYSTRKAPVYVLQNAHNRGFLSLEQQKGNRNGRRAGNAGRPSTERRHDILSSEGSQCQYSSARFYFSASSMRSVMFRFLISWQAITALYSGICALPRI